MEGKLSLQKIIESVLDDYGVEYASTGDSTVRTLRRAFDRLMVNLGSDKKLLKNDGRTMEFDEVEARIIKIIISQLYDENSIASKFTNSHAKNSKFSSDEVETFIQAFLDEISKDEKISQEDMEYLANFLGNVFLFSPLRSLENCHKMIDMLATNLEDLDYDDQSVYLGMIEHILKKEVVLRKAESVIGMVEVARDKYRNSFYCEVDPKIRFFYIQRDRAILDVIQRDDELRKFIEGKLGRKAEEIYNYAHLA